MSNINRAAAIAVPLALACALSGCASREVTSIPMVQPGDGGVIGASTSVEDVEDGFAKSVAEIVKTKG